MSDDLMFDYDYDIEDYILAEIEYEDALMFEADMYEFGQVDDQGAPYENA